MTTHQNPLDLSLASKFINHPLTYQNRATHELNSAAESTTFLHCTICLPPGVWGSATPATLLLSRPITFNLLHIIQTICTIIGEAARKPPVLTGGGIASLTFCTYHLYSAVLGYTLRSLLPIRDRQYRYSKMVTTGDHTSKHHAILDVRRTTV